jgi:hypothetical protein
MTRMGAEPATGQVVRLGDGGVFANSAPTELPLPLRVGAAGRSAIAVLLALATLAAAGLIGLLWVADTPGWWFSALFTVMLAGLAAAFWLAFAAARQDARAERVAAAAWRRSSALTRPHEARVADRHVHLDEDGTVSAFDLEVVLTDSTAAIPIRATWRLSADARIQLLQPQVPNSGAAARVWLLPGSPADAPLVIDVLDPTVVAQQDGSDTPSG